jgi:glutamine amidotransferase
LIAIIDYNVGNLASVKNGFDKIDVKTQVVKDSDKLNSFDKVLLPGVGAFGDAMVHLEKSGMKDAILEFAKSGKPMLGICLGMQLLFKESQEFGITSGLGLIDGKIVKFDTTKFQEKLKVPHMGWNKMFLKQQSPLFKNIDDPYLYFVHSYHAVCDEKYVIGKTHYGYDFVSAVQKDNIFGFQPHPEKSHEIGLKILKNFAEL